MPGASSSQDSLIHVHTVVMSGFLSDPETVKVCLVESISHSVHFNLIFSLKGLLMLTSKGCSWDVRPPGITQVSVFSITVALFPCFLANSTTLSLNLAS